MNSDKSNTMLVQHKEQRKCQKQIEKIVDFRPPIFHVEEYELGNRVGCYTKHLPGDGVKSVERKWLGHIHIMSSS